MSRLTHVTSGPYAPPPAARELTAVSADGARLYVQVHGPEGAPAVVLAHGWTCSTAFWAAQVRDLATDHRVIAYDQRGHGRSPAAADADGYSTRALADDLEAVLAAALAPGEKAVLVGHSMGAMTLVAAAGRRGLREHGAAALLCNTGASDLVAEATVLPMRAGRLRTRLTRSVLGSSAPLGPVTPVGRSVLKYATMGRAASREQAEACARIVHSCPRLVRRSWSHMLRTLRIDRNVPELTLPTRVVTGLADRLTPPVHARRIAAALPDGRLTELTGVGHMSPVEAPDAVNLAIRELTGAYLGTASAPQAETPARETPANETPVPVTPANETTAGERDSVRKKPAPTNSGQTKEEAA
ncbi:Non-heme chloroperoxidase [Streptomyces sp. YIM 130001]|uniref:alpha/beta fold hydrolase n=1 Tax=Streptomyces sp. YIM 130001 TaxID=2259644 RepID=UPI000E6596D1|nr:alpha/beta hydrolase [Streptomyces sp. YIM 130001]RII14993.1 Non-heme chloroperoxidase [Streptomyces sp. YIM 130001]